MGIWGILKQTKSFGNLVQNQIKYLNKDSILVQNRGLDNEIDFVSPNCLPYASKREKINKSTKPRQIYIKARVRTRCRLRLESTF